MKKILLAPAVCWLALIPGDSAGFPHGEGSKPAAAHPAAAPIHTPAFTAPHAEHVGRPAGENRAAFAPQERAAPKTQDFGGGNHANVGNNVVGNHPTVGINNKANIGGIHPNVGINNKPNIGNQAISGINNKNNVGNLNAGINNKNNVGNQANIGVNNRPEINSNNAFNPNISGGNKFNQANLGGGNSVNVNASTNVANNPNLLNKNNINQVSRNVNATQPNGVYRPGYSYYHNYYGDWHHGYWNSWNYQPWLWGGASLSTGLILGATVPNVAYVNPYYDVPPVNVLPVYNYSLPIPVPAPVLIGNPNPAMVQQGPPLPPQPPLQPTDAKSIAATNFLNQARAAFMKKDYDAAQLAIDKAVEQLPNDATLHEFRALVLFARKDYREAAAAIYAVLAVGPGWDWDTMKSLYPDVDTYTQQLRALESYCRDNPMAASARFVLSYEYLVLDSRDAAAKTLKSVVALQPDNQLASYMLTSLEGKDDSNKPAPGT